MRLPARCTAFAYDMVQKFKILLYRIALWLLRTLFGRFRRRPNTLISEVSFEKGSDTPVSVMDTNSTGSGCSRFERTATPYYCFYW